MLYFINNLVKYDMSEKKITREEVKISHVCILGRGWGEEHAIPKEKAELLLGRIGEVERLEGDTNFNWRVTLDERLDTIGAQAGSSNIFMRESSPKSSNVGNVAYWGTTWLDLDKLKSELDITTDDI